MIEQRKALEKNRTQKGGILVELPGKNPPYQKRQDEPENFRKERSWNSGPSKRLATIVAILLGTDLKRTPRRHLSVPQTFDLFVIKIPGGRGE